MVKVRYADRKLKLIETDKAHTLGLPFSVIGSARRKIRFIREAVDERDLAAMKSLHYEKLRGTREGQRSIRLNNQWRLVLEVDKESTPMEIVIIEIVDYHK